MTLQLAKIMLVLLIVAYGCGDNNTGGNNPPSIIYEGLSKDTMVQGILGDSIVVFLNFEDIDGDLSSMDGRDISIVDNRDGFNDPVSFPALPDLKQGTRGQLKLTIQTTCCVFPDNIQPCESPEAYPSNRYTYDISIVDRAGNRSNVITTDSITLLCL